MLLGHEVFSTSIFIDCKAFCFVRASEAAPFPNQPIGQSGLYNFCVNVYVGVMQLMTINNNSLSPNYLKHIYFLWIYNFISVGMYCPEFCGKVKEALMPGVRRLS